MVEHQSPSKISRDAAIHIFTNGKDTEICDSLVSIAFYDNDWKWVQSQCLHFLDHPNADVRGVAAICLGHVARIHHKLDKNIVVAALKKKSADSEISGRIQDALDDIEMFLD